MKYYGKPKDVSGECNAHLYIADDYASDAATMRCGLTPGHEGVHVEVFQRRHGEVVVTWVQDERDPLDCPAAPGPLHEGED